MNISEKLKSRKFWVTIVTALVIGFNDALGVGLDGETITQVVAVVAAYILGQGVVDATQHNAEAKKYQAWVTASAMNGSQTKQSE